MRLAAHVVLLLLCLAALPGAAQAPPERWRFTLGDGEWKLVQPDMDAPAGEQIYVRPGENAYFWTERITSGYKVGGASLDDYAKAFTDELLERCRPLKVSPVMHSPASVIFQWEGDCRVVGPQFEYRRVASVRSGVHYLAYASKPSRLTPEKKEAWLAVIRNATLK